MFGGETRDSLKLQRAVTAERVTNAQGAAIHDPDHVTGPCLLYGHAIAGHELLRRRQANGLAAALMQHLHVGFKMSRHDAHEGNAVAMPGIHVRLDLEHETGKVVAIGRHRSDGGFARSGRRRQLQKFAEKRFDPEVGERRPEEHGGQCSVDYARVFVPVPGGIEQLDIRHQAIERTRAHRVDQRWVIDADDGLVGPRRATIAAALEEMHFTRETIIHADENIIVEHRPRGRVAIDRQIGLHVLNQLERVFAIPVALVHQRKDRRASQLAHIEQLPRALFDTLAIVQQHDGAVGRHQRAIGVF